MVINIIALAWWVGDHAEAEYLFIAETLKDEAEYLFIAETLKEKLKTILQVAGSDQYFLADCPISQYK